ncbi:MAG: EamA family transporter, partial [Rhodospirillaceae bacterium]
MLVGAVAVGASAIFVRLSELGPISSAYYRPFLAIPMVWLWLVLIPKTDIEQRAASAKDYGLLALAGAFFAGDLAFWHLSLHHTSVANATLFANSAPVVVVLADRLLFRRSIGRTFVLGLI